MITINDVINLLNANFIKTQKKINKTNDKFKANIRKMNDKTPERRKIDVNEYRRPRNLIPSTQKIRGNEIKARKGLKLVKKTKKFTENS